MIDNQLPLRTSIVTPQQSGHRRSSIAAGSGYCNGQCFSFKRLKSNLLGEHDVTFHKLAFRKEAQTPDALSFSSSSSTFMAPAKRMR